ncbi:hypothetical protein MFRU_013g01100 [Monilinia fructicola]|nr:hypothetical protein MFRU_013g01100 [Monilinia fructicola]
MTQPMLYIVYRCSHELPDTNALMERREICGPERKISFLKKMRRAMSFDVKVEPIRRPCMDLCRSCQAKEHALDKQRQMAQSGRYQVPKSLPQPPAVTQYKQSIAPHSLEGPSFSTSDALKLQPERISTPVSREEPTAASEARSPSPGLMEMWDVFDVQALSKARKFPDRPRRQLQRAPELNLRQGLKRRNTTSPEKSRLQIRERAERWALKKVDEAIKTINMQKNRDESRQAPQVSDQTIQTSNSSHKIESNNSRLISSPRYYPSGAILEEKESPPDPRLIPEALRFRKLEKKKREERGGS